MKAARPFLSYVRDGVTVALVTAVLVLALELAVVRFSDVQFFGNSANLFAARRFGSSRGNAPNTHAISFGEDVFTDSEGFRVPSATYTYPTSSAHTVLFLGDSVAFGSGVPEGATFIGLLRQHHPDWTFYNAAVMGFYHKDYVPVVDIVLRDHKDISAVYLIFALNDVVNVSAQNLQTLENRANEPGIPGIHWVEHWRTVSLIDRANLFLRERSKLYLYLKNRLSDPARRYFLADWIVYRDRQAVIEAVRTLNDIAVRLKRAGIIFTVILCPYEFQLRSTHGTNEVDVLLPQRLLGEYLTAQGIHYIDALEWFRSDGASSSADYFIRFDPMHFSRKGHQVMNRGIEETLQSK